MLTMMEEYENQNQNSEADFEDPTYKIVRHKLDASDTGDGDKGRENKLIKTVRGDGYVFTSAITAE